MKKNKFIFIMLLFCFVSLNALGDYSLRLAYGMMNKEEISGYGLSDGSYDLSGEFLIDPLESVSVGFGVQYIWPAEYSTFPENKNIVSNPINSITPLYGIAVVNIMPDSNISPYLIGRLGYGFASSNPNSNAKDLTGDLHYSLGIGGVFKNFFAELTYDVNSGSYSYSNGTSESYELQRFTLRFGYWFKFVTHDRHNIHDEQIEVIKSDGIKEIDNLEIYDDEGNIKNKQGSYRELRDFKIID